MPPHRACVRPPLTNPKDVECGLWRHDGGAVCCGKTDAFVACWDTAPRPFMKHIKNINQREKQADELYAQIPIVQEGLVSGAESFFLDGYEADDLIGTLHCCKERSMGNRDRPAIERPATAATGYFRHGL